jgi:predicted protein tyrosine phosphatase
VFATDPRLSVRSAGTSTSARRRVNERDLRWADLVCVMERHHATRLRELFPKVRPRELVVLDIPDDYEAMDPRLVDMLRSTVAPELDRRLPPID